MKLSLSLFVALSFHLSAYANSESITELYSVKCTHKERRGTEAKKEGYLSFTFNGDKTELKSPVFAQVKDYPHAPAPSINREIFLYNFNRSLTTVATTESTVTYRSGTLSDNTANLTAELTYLNGEMTKLYAKEYSRDYDTRNGEWYTYLRNEYTCDTLKEMSASDILGNFQIGFKQLHEHNVKRVSAFYIDMGFVSALYLGVLPGEYEIKISKSVPRGFGKSYWEVIYQKSFRDDFPTQHWQQSFSVGISNLTKDSSLEDKTLPIYIEDSLWKNGIKIDMSVVRKLDGIEKRYNKSLVVPGAPVDPCAIPGSCQ